MSTEQTIHVGRRPYILSFYNGGSYPVSSEEVERLLAEYPVRRFSANKLDFDGSEGYRAQIYPATLGGGPAFTRI